jgi:drug/metabolite transporter (DMT)-like permease
MREGKISFLQIVAIVFSVAGGFFIVGIDKMIMLFSGNGELFEFNYLYGYGLALVNVIDQGLCQVSQKKCSATIPATSTNFYISLFSIVLMAFVWIPFYKEFTPAVFLDFIGVCLLTLRGVFLLIFYDGSQQGYSLQCFMLYIRH